MAMSSTSRATLSIQWSQAFWPEVMNSGAMRSALQRAADEKASEAEARIGSSARADRFDNADFYADVVTRHGTSSNYLIGLVRAGNPRSIYKSIHDGALQ